MRRAKIKSESLFLAQRDPERRPERFNSIRVNRAKLPGALVTGIRILALALIVLAIFLLGADLLTTLEKGGELTVRSIAQVWSTLSEASLQAAQKWALKTHLMPVFASVLTLPGWGVSGVVGVLIAFLAGRPDSAKS